MKPPVCELCGLDFRDKDIRGHLLTFHCDNQTIDETEGKPAGHPKDSAWFCADHLDEARKLTGMSLNDALTELKKKIRNFSS